MLRRQVDGEVHDGHRRHAERAIGRVERAGYLVVGAQVGQVGGGGDNHGAERALQT